MGFYGDLMGSNGDLMGFDGDLMGSNGDLMGFYGDLMGSRPPGKAMRSADLSTIGSRRSCNNHQIAKVFWSFLCWKDLNSLGGEKMGEGTNKSVNKNEHSGEIPMSK